jgi:hypothetical protein
MYAHFIDRGPVAKMTQNVIHAADRELRSNILANSIPGGVNDALADFTKNVADTIEDCRKKGIDPRPFLTPGTKEYLGNSATVNAFVNRNANAERARIATDAEKSSLPVVDTVEKYDALGPGVSFLSRDKNSGELVKKTTPANKKVFLKGKEIPVTPLPPPGTMYNPLAPGPYTPPK